MADIAAEFQEILLKAQESERRLSEQRVMQDRKLAAVRALMKEAAILMEAATMRLLFLPYR